MTDTTHPTYPVGTTVIPEQTSTIEDSVQQVSGDEETLDEELFDDELEEELIIEDFTIDGICGVY